jgi:hypothetical protein
MNGEWKEVTVGQPHCEGYAWAGLLIVHAYDGESGGIAPNHFEIWHESSREFMLEVDASLGRTQEIAGALADVADWASLSTTDEVMLQARLMAFGAGYQEEVAVYNDWTAIAALDRIVPYGLH